MLLILIIFLVKYQFTQNDFVDILAKIIKRYLITSNAMQSTLPKQSIPTYKNNHKCNEHTVKQLPSQSITNHCIETQPRKNKPPLQWSITSLESQQIVNCDDYTVKVNIFCGIWSIFYAFYVSNRPSYKRAN